MKDYSTPCREPARISPQSPRTEGVCLAPRSSGDGRTHTPASDRPRAPHARPAGARPARAAILSALTAEIRAIERRPAQFEPGSRAARPRALATAGLPAADRAPPTAPAPWDFGAPEIDRRLPLHGLDPAAIHELKPHAYGDTPAALALAIRLAVRRQQMSGPHARPIVWCAASRHAGEWGRPYGPGIAQLGLQPGCLVVVEAARHSDTLWALEEVLRSGAATAVIAVLDDVDLTAARRLALAAAAGAGTPGLLVTPAHAAGVAAAHTRWRIRAHPSAPHALGLAAPGSVRLDLMLEHCRPAVVCTDDDWIAVEWSDVTHRFRLAAPLADRAPRGLPARRRAG